MASGGVYDAHSEYQMRGALQADELIGELAGKIASRGRDALVIVDYGCAQGRVTNALIHTAISRIRAVHRDLPVAVYHNDLLDNDWTALFDRLRAADSYLHMAGGPITPLVAATSFYQPVTPPRVVDLGMSFAAAQWLGQPGPADTGTALYFDQLDGTAREQMAAQAAEDWARFLELRAAELLPHGQLVVNLMCVLAGGGPAGHDLWQVVRAVCAEMADEGRIDDARLDAYVIPVYERSVTELRRPFEQDVSDRFQLEQVATRPVPNPAAERYAADGDTATFARDFTAFFRAWSEPTLRAGLALGDSEVAELYDRVQERIRTAAHDFRFEVTAATVVARRRS